MFKITIEATTEKHKELLQLFRDHVCYSINQDSQLKVESKGWDGHSGGDDAYYGLTGKVKVIINEPT
jgi:hypothetical protein